MMTIDDVIYCVNCRGLQVEWFDCDKHDDTECYVLKCDSCNHHDYDCEEL
jgi:hypothetical protein